MFRIDAFQTEINNQVKKADLQLTIDKLIPCIRHFNIYQRILYII